jgi:ACT domain-containing protein
VKTSRETSDDSADLRDLIARVSRQVARRLGSPRAGADLAAIVAAEVTAALAASESAAPAASESAAPVRVPSATVRAELCASCLEEARRKTGRRAIVTTTGKNRKGMVAKIAQGIADAGGDILDISQTLVADYFTMIIIIDMSSLQLPFTEFKARLTDSVRSLGADCLVMHEDVVTALQRI